MPPRHLLVLRFSALGDVAMTVPVIKLLLEQHPHLQITYVSNAFVQPFFKGFERLNFYVVDPKEAHKGVKGMYRLYNELRNQAQFDAVADLHNVLRTKVLRMFFSLSNIKIAAIDKGRKEKWELTRIKNKKLRPLKSTFERYAQVFADLGLPVNLSSPVNLQKRGALPPAKPLKRGTRLVGVAPFAKHAEKMYPLEKMKEVIALLAVELNIEIFLFGGREEALFLEGWAQDWENVTSLAGKMSFDAELNYVSQLSLMVSMDSANMHLASLFGVPVVSVWGSTHPFAGFYGWGQAPENAVQVPLYCRPCSVFGNKKCFRGDLACLHSITPENIVKRVLNEMERGECRNED